MAYDLVIFDCDGVLVDSEPLANRTLSEAFIAAGFPISYETCCEHMLGLPLRTCLEMAEQWCSRPLPQNFLEDLQARTFAALRAELRPVPGVRAAVLAVTVSRCVASSSDPDKLALSLSVTGLDKLFGPHVFSASQVARGKPHPDLFLFAAERMGFAPAHCAVVEDTLHGVRAAHAAGMDVFGFVGGSLSKALEREGAATFSDMAHLPALLGFQPPGVEA